MIDPTRRPRAAACGTFSAVVGVAEVNDRHGDSTRIEPHNVHVDVIRQLAPGGRPVQLSSRGRLTDVDICLTVEEAIRCRASLDRALRALGR